VPKKVKSIQSFVSLCSYYRRFVPNFSKIVKPLTRLTEKNVKFEWTDECAHAFNTLKKALTNAQCLAYPDEFSPTEIHTDASKEGLGCTLVQIQDGIERVVAYGSRSLRKYERNYSASELECLGVLYAIERFHPYIYGRRFRVVTDHCALCLLMKTKDPQGRLARWSLRLQPYDFEIVYKSGRKHLAVDALSRNPVDAPPSTNHDEFDFEQHLCKLDVIVEQLCSIHCDNLIQLQMTDSKVAKIYKAVKELLENSNSNTEAKNKLADYTIKDETLYKLNPEEFGRMWRVVVPKKLQHEIMEQLHAESGSHLGFLRTWYLLKAKYYWSGMYRCLRKFINACGACQFANSRCTGSPGPMQLVDPPLQPFERIGMDYMGPFPTTHPHQNKYILVVIDHLTRYVEASPCKAADTKSAIQVLKESVILRHSCPSEILCDNGSCFRSSEFQSFCREYGTKLLFTTAYHPNTNGICERVNGTIKRCLGKMVNDHHNDWDRHLSKVVLSVNITMHKVTKYSPFYLLHEREPNLKCDVRLKLNEEYADEN